MCFLPATSSIGHFAVDHLVDHFAGQFFQPSVDHFGANHFANHFTRKLFQLPSRSFWVDHFTFDHFGAIILLSIILLGDHFSGKVLYLPSAHLARVKQ